NNAAKLLRRCFAATSRIELTRRAHEKSAGRSLRPRRSDSVVLEEIMSRNAPKCILGAVVVAVFFALTWSTTAARLSPTTAGSAAKPIIAVAPTPAEPAALRTFAQSSATVTTDKVDYQPGE